MRPDDVRTSDALIESLRQGILPDDHLRDPAALALLCLFEGAQRVAHTIPAPTTHRGPRPVRRPRPVRGFAAALVALAVLASSGVAVAAGSHPLTPVRIVFDMGVSVGERFDGPPVTHRLSNRLDRSHSPYRSAGL